MDNLDFLNIVFLENEVKDYLSNLEIDDIPLIPTQLELSQLVILPKLSSEKKKEILKKVIQSKEQKSFFQLKCLSYSRLNRLTKTIQ